MISTFSPGCRIVVTDQFKPGPDRQFTGCPFGDAKGTLAGGTGVTVGAAGGAGAVSVATSAALMAVGGTGAVSVGVTPVAFTSGQLHATIMMAAKDKKMGRRFLMHPPFVYIVIVCQTCPRRNMPSVLPAHLPFRSAST
jgi:hypothetical protein